MRNSTWLWVVIVIILIALGIWWYSAQSPAATSPAANDTLGAANGADAGAGAGIEVGASAGTLPMSAEVTYDGTSFSPASVTVAEGGTVHFTNTGTGRMWVASDKHPTHTEYDGTTLQQHCATGGSFDQC